MAVGRETSQTGYRGTPRFRVRNNNLGCQQHPAPAHRSRSARHRNLHLVRWPIESGASCRTRVQARVRRGGHDIHAENIHRRYEHSRLELIELLPHLRALRVFDNSKDADPAAGRTPKPKLVLQMERGNILNQGDLEHTPDWAKPIVAGALKLMLS